jgi:hypothetical protein
MAHAPYDHDIIVIRVCIIKSINFWIKTCYFGKIGLMAIKFFKLLNLGENHIQDETPQADVIGY